MQRLEVKAMHSYEIDLRQPNGLRVCLLSVAFARDGSAIHLAESMVKMNGSPTHVVVWREDEVIFESAGMLRFH
jgi:hypothetical protein